jgi:5'-nucleotidase (lipoprotein e(P4) family)
LIKKIPLLDHNANDYPYARYANCFFADHFLLCLSAPAKQKGGDSMKGNKRKLKFAFVVLLILSFLIGCKYTAKDLNEQSVLALDWIQTSAEFRAISYQNYNLAKMNLDRFLASYSGSRPVAVVTDMDETITDNSAYQAFLVGQDFARSSRTWGSWIVAAQAKAMPGAVEFFNYAKQKGVETFYISNTKNDLLEDAQKKLKSLGFPYVDDKHMLFQTNSSGKQERRGIVAKNYEIALLLGDNLNDFLSVFAQKPIAERSAEVDKIKTEWGNKFIVFPNPLYGDWEKALYKGNWGASPAEKDKMRKDALERWNYRP